MKSFRLFLAAALGLTGASWAAAETPVPLTVSGNEATGSVTLAGAVGVELTLTFEQAVGLNPAALDVSARLTDSLDLELLARLGGLAPPAAFPLVLTIEPSPSSALSFAGVATVSLHTHQLHLNPAVPMSLLSASGGGTFRDVTRSEGIGSYRVSGSTGGFSEFVIVVDTRPIDAVIAGKLDALDALLAENAEAIAPTALADLEARLAQVRTLYLDGSTVAAATEVGGFEQAVEAQSGAAIPDVYRAHDDRVNVAGRLRAAADTLKFSFNRKASGAP